MQVNVAIPDQEALVKSAQATQEIVQAITITSPELYSEAGEMLGSIKARIKDLNDKRLAITRPLDEAKKHVMGLFAPAIERLEQAELALKTQISLYDDQVTAQREQAGKEAEAAAAKERERLAAIAAEAEAKAKAELEAAQAAQAQLERQAAEALAAGNPKGLELAIAAEKAANNVEQAREKQIEVAETAAVALIPEAVTATLPALPKASGVSFSITWGAYEVVDRAAFLAFVASAPQNHNLVEDNSVAIRALIRAQKEHFNVPGLRSIPTKQVKAKAS